MQIGFDPGLSLVPCHTDFDGEPVSVSNIPQKERLDTVLPAVSIPFSAECQIGFTSGFWILDFR